MTEYWFTQGWAITRQLNTEWPPACFECLLHIQQQTTEGTQLDIYPKQEEKLSVNMSMENKSLSRPIKRFSKVPISDTDPIQFTTIGNASTVLIIKFK